MSVGPPTWTLAVGVRGPGTRYDAVTERQGAVLDIVDGTQVIPSFEYAVADVLLATATNRPVVGLTVTESHAEELGIVAATQVMPSFEYAAAVCW